MMKKRVIRAGWILLLVLAAAGEALADQRNYVWTYEYLTVRKGKWELETYVTSEVPDINRSNINTLKPWIELEYGITRNWDVAMYQMWKFKNKRFENDSEYDGFKLRTRYKFGKKGQFPVDTLLYFEYFRPGDMHKPNVGEVKLILAKDINRINLSYNQIVKADLASTGLAEWQYALGANYAFNFRFHAGIESKGNYTKDQYAIGPTLAFVTKKFWVTFGSAFGLNRKTDDLQTRVIVGVPF